MSAKRERERRDPTDSSYEHLPNLESGGGERKKGWILEWELQIARERTFCREKFMQVPGPFIPDDEKYGKYSSARIQAEAADLTCLTGRSQ